ncbi:MAG: hypothetical protein COT39_03065 [Parcubacteria group bacterium CG08_land_8_20_14_0_20_48_21]|nr:MAG: hypothetical protein AUK21_00420 [Parcubacteria group bacterium CG2_30_48_51]PIS32718.1 MAG: hypothetical protein COT39_03065 [Parcubacteria group bacterium CG08_land_8_20_14_0_20_48_21]PIW79617.1 MAG: hypothetical protein COZ99_00050 [Parcubacteria group bacterium CG_4_8_14_3_um_filter_48_16]PIY78275.1 MAG: hypothetical protein COY83_00745 [Parcubacteria group bacterium CG_4_10_14_0_8_um_filter_48_154]PIZ77384.1 MAG: hypothetical protein COY03_03085 [bacterium CG_4_10_14_0_2_um_filter_
MKEQVRIMHFTGDAKEKQAKFTDHLYWFGLQAMTGYFFVTLGVVVGITLISGFLFLLRPEYFNIHTTLRSSAEVLESEVANLQVQENYTEHLIGTYEKLARGQEEKIARVVPEELTSADLFFMLDDFALQAGMRIQNISLTDAEARTLATVPDRKSGVAAGANAPSSPASFAVQKQLSITLAPVAATEGGISYPQFKNFLGVIETHTPLFDLPLVSFTPGQQTLTVTLTTYAMR